MKQTIQSYNLDSFSDNNGGGATEFISYFDDLPASPFPPPSSKNETTDVESEARKIFENAYVQGEKAGLEMGMKKVEPLTKRLNNDIAMLSEFQERLVEKTERLSVELALIFAEAVILKECNEKNDAVVNMVKKALELCEDRNEITIRIRKDDAQHLTETMKGTVRVIPDDALQEPGFIIETRFGDIDGMISTQMEELKKEFLGSY